MDLFCGGVLMIINEVRNGNLYISENCIQYNFDLCTNSLVFYFELVVYECFCKKKYPLYEITCDLLQLHFEIYYLFIVDTVFKFYRQIIYRH